MVKFSHFLITGWGIPLLNMIIWSLLKVLWPNKSEEDFDDQVEIDQELDDELSCPFFELDQETDFFFYKLPIIVLLGINSIFLIWIMVIVLSKLNSRIAMDHDRRHLKAAKVKHCFYQG